MDADLLAVITIFGAVVLGAASPGPAFVYISQRALAHGRRVALAGALGVGLGSVVFAVAAMLGLAAVLATSGWLFAVLKVAGGVYLIVLGVRLWRHAGEAAPMPSGVPAPTGSWRAIAAGAIMQLSNPKAVVVYGSIFAALTPQHPSPWLFAVIPLGVLAIETAWYALVAVSMSARRPRALYGRIARTVDRVAGVGLGGLGAWFTADGVRTVLR